MKLGPKDKFILLFIALIAVTFAASKFIIKPLGDRIEWLMAEKTETLGLKTDISPLIEKSKKLKNQEELLRENVENIRNADGGKTLTEEEFLVFLGNSTKKNSVSVIDFSNIDQAKDDGLYRSIFDFEIRGDSKNIGKVLRDIEDLGIKCSYGSLSYRQNAEYDYLMRFFDLFTELPWYKEEDFNEEQEEENTVLEEQEDMFKSDVKTSEMPIEEYPYKIPEQEILPENKREDINDRLNSLLEPTYSRTQQGSIMLLTNKTAKSSQDMRLAVTVCFVMFTEPSESHSILDLPEV